MSETNEERDSDLAEAERLETTASLVSEELSKTLLAEAQVLRDKWPTAVEEKEIVVTVSDAEAREKDLVEAKRIMTMASTLRPGSARSALEKEAEALRAKWPDFPDDSDGQIRRLMSYLETNGLARPGIVPVRAILEHVASLKKEHASLSGNRNCHGCGLPVPHATAHVVNAFLVNAVKAFETDGSFRDQVVSGQITPGMCSHPWIPGSAPHRGPAHATSPWALPTLATMVRNDPDALREVGPKLRAALKERGISIPAITTH